MRSLGPIATALPIALAALSVAADAGANERHFTYAYESGVLPTGTRELEVWTTWRGGRRRYYSAFDHRFEFEVGLTSRLQTAFYLNAGSVTSDDGLGQRPTRFESRGVSSEWKYKLLDPVADPVGLALYGEIGAASDHANLETKVIVDKRVGKFLLATNLVFEPEWSFAKEKTRREFELALQLAGAYFVLPNLSVGAEVGSLSELDRSASKFEWSSLHAGPVLAYAHEGWWAAVTVLRQLPAPVRDDPTSIYVLRAGERYNARLLFSFHL